MNNMSSTHILVPVDLTLEMLSAMADKAREVGSGDFVALWKAAVAAAPPLEVDAAPTTAVPSWLTSFLLGEDHWPGHPDVWFGDSHPTERGSFFWRRYLASAPLSPG
ncbi:hypothetical protein JMG10_13220 [Nostoc ellipsosporum NOK]|nr:hypothetical protein [Nostoc ellipsosporum NOK]